MSDLTVIFLTANQHPEHFTQYHRDVLLRAAQGHEIISVSREPVDVGTNLIDTGPRSHANMYYQLMKAAKVATTPYVAVAEDDTLYTQEHFAFFRPPLDTFGYNMHRWSLYTWVPELFSIKRRKSNCTLIAPRELLIETWEERFSVYPVERYPIELVGEVGRENIDEGLGVQPRKSVEVWSSTGVIHINHPNGTDSLGTRKKLGEIKAIEIPYWGKASDIAKHYV